VFNDKFNRSGYKRELDKEEVEQSLKLVLRQARA